MAVVESRLRTETVYVPGRDMQDAVTRREFGSYETPQEAYNSIDDWEANQHNYDVFEFHTVLTVLKVNPPYTKR